MGAVTTYYIRLILTAKKQKLDNFNFYLNNLEDTLKLMTKESLDFVDGLAAVAEKSNSRNLRPTYSGKFIKFKPSKNRLIEYCEARRQLMVSRHRHLKRICNSLKLIEPSLFPVPGDKLIAINKAVSHLYEVDPVEGVLLLFNSTNDLACHYERQISL